MSNNDAVQKIKEEYLVGFVDDYSYLYSSENKFDKKGNVKKEYSDRKQELLGKNVRLGTTASKIEKIALDSVCSDKNIESPCIEISWKHIAWKAGKLKYNAKGFEEDDSLFVSGKYAWDGKRVDGGYIGRKRNEQGLDEEIRRERIKNYIRLINKHYKNSISKNITFKCAYEDLLEYNIECYNFGTVYTIALICFLSKGSLPIYDKFAHKAAKAIYLGVSPSEVYVGEAPDKTDEDSVYNMYNEYCWLLKQIFGTYGITRKQDQALWVYGHSKKIYKGKNELPKLSVKDKVFKKII